MKQPGLSTLFTGLSRQVLVWFLLISLVPFAVVCSVAYYAAKKSLSEHAHETLATNVNERAAFISNWFNYRFIDLQMQANNTSNTLFIEELHRAYKKSNKPLGDFVKSHQWNLLADEKKQNLATFKNLYGYHDIFLIDMEGNILFTLAGKDDLGTNLFTGLLAKTAFAKSSKKILETGRMGFSDLMRYAPSNNDVAGFFISVILSKEGEKVGLFAFQIDAGQIKFALHKLKANERHNIQTYVIGQSDKQDEVTLRTPLETGVTIKASDPTRAAYQATSANYLQQRIKTEQTRLWMNEQAQNGVKIKAADKQSHIYKGPSGDSVLGTHRSISVGNINWGIVAEITEDAAFAPIVHLKRLVAALALIIGLLVVVLAALLTRRIVAPISAISTALTEVSKGDIQQWIDIKTSHELNTLVLGFNHMITTLNDAADRANEIAMGDYSANITPKSDKDRLNLTLQEMIENLRNISLAAAQVARGNTSISVVEQSANDLLAQSFNAMIRSLKNAEQESKARNWLQEGNNQLKDKIQGDLALTDLAHNAIGFLCNYLGAKTGAFYIIKNQIIQLEGSYAFQIKESFCSQFAMGEGLAGQAALEQRTLTLTDIPDDYLTISSGLGETLPKAISITPIIWDRETVALLEFAAITPFSELHEQFIEMVTPAIAIAVLAAQSRDQTQELLKQTQSQAEELQAREEALQDYNDLLFQQAKELKKSEQLLRDNQAKLEGSNKQLQKQQEELRMANEELERHSSNLKVSHDRVERRNRHIEQARLELEQKSKELALSNKYKSEFLANMSHELRTPLNSLLILSGLLADNKDGNLTSKQVEFSQTIHDSGSDLLMLINNILDLSKIESGKMEAYIETIHLKDFVAQLDKKFRPLAKDRGVSLKIKTDQAPNQWQSDGQKLGQIITNLLSNAIKFTDQGEVTLYIGSTDSTVQLRTPGLTPETTLTISITDTGIGVPEEKCKAIFEAFQQADGSISRKYGGTGLGLPISQELAKLLGGEIQIKSKPGQGSCFSLYIPMSLTVKAAETSTIAKETSPPFIKPKAKAGVGDNSPDATRSASPSRVPDDCNDLKPGDRYTQSTIIKDAYSPEQLPDDTPLFLHCAESDLPEKQCHMIRMLHNSEFTFEGCKVLVVDDDMRNVFAISAALQERKMQVLMAKNGIEALKKLVSNPDTAIVLMDVMMPGIDGYEVMRKIREQQCFNKLPIIALTAKAMKGDRAQCIKAGADDYLAKPVEIEKLLSMMQVWLYR